MTQRFLFYHVKQLNAVVIDSEQTIKLFALPSQLTWFYSGLFPTDKFARCWLRHSTTQMNHR